jgi:uncharacterized protein (DUF1697 family)
MSRFVVLLRGVNVGKANPVPMADFREALESLGHGSVQTLLNSGNAVFSSSTRSTEKLAEGIATVMRQRFKVVTPVIVKSAAEMADAVDNNPFPPPEADNSRFLVAFAMDPAKLKELSALGAFRKPGERFAINAHAAYLYCAGGLLESKAAKAILGSAGRYVTTRNLGTVLKLSALLRESVS